MYRAGAGCYGPSKAALEAHTHIMAHDLEGTGVTANVLIPGGPVNTRMIPVASGVDRGELIQPTVMREPVVWLCSDDSDGVNGMRFIALRWDPVAPARGTHRSRRRPRRLDPARRSVGAAGLGPSPGPSRLREGGRQGARGERISLSPAGRGSG